MGFESSFPDPTPIRLFGIDLYPVDAPRFLNCTAFSTAVKSQFEIRIWIGVDVGQPDVGAPRGNSGSHCIGTLMWMSNHRWEPVSRRALTSLSAGNGSRLKARTISRSFCFSAMGSTGQSMRLVPFGTVKSRKGRRSRSRASFQELSWLWSRSSAISPSFTRSLERTF